MSIEQLRAALIDRGYREQVNGLADNQNDCKSLFYRRTGLKAAPCETNEDKADQIAIYPFVYPFLQDDEVRLQFEACGESGGIWFKLQAYSLTAEEALERLAEIESRLIAAWNAVATPNTQATAAGKQPVERLERVSK